MNRGAWQATDHGIAESGTTERLTSGETKVLFRFITSGVRF